MTPDTVTTIAQQTLEVTVLLSAPLLLSALAVGFVIGVFQAATQINEMTLSFIPKLLALVAVIYIGSPWFMRTMMGFTERLFESIPTLIG